MPDFTQSEEDRKAEAEWRKEFGAARPGLIRKWLRDLRSGKYAQATGYLCEIRRDGSRGYCCLGVFVKSFGGTFEPLMDTNGNANICQAVLPIEGHTLATMVLPAELARALGVHDFGMPVKDPESGDISTTLTEMNDSGQYDFPAIADFILANLESLFKHMTRNEAMEIRKPLSDDLWENSDGE